MKNLRRLLMTAVPLLGLLAAQPAQASAEDIFCWYMGDVRDNYGGTGAKYYCEMWHRGEFLLAYTIVEPY